MLGVLHHRSMCRVGVLIGGGGAGLLWIVDFFFFNVYDEQAIGSTVSVLIFGCWCTYSFVSFL